MTDCSFTSTKKTNWRGATMYICETCRVFTWHPWIHTRFGTGVKMPPAVSVPVPESIDDPPVIRHPDDIRKMLNLAEENYLILIGFSGDRYLGPPVSEIAPARTSGIIDALEWVLCEGSIGELEYQFEEEDNE